MNRLPGTQPVGVSNGAIAPRSSSNVQETMEKETQYRVVRKEENGHWRIKTGDFKSLPLKEKEVLRKYLSEIRICYHNDKNDILIDGDIEWDTVYEQLSRLYDGLADVTPF